MSFFFTAAKEIAADLSSLCPMKSCGAQLQWVEKRQGEEFETVHRLHFEKASL